MAKEAAPLKSNKASSLLRGWQTLDRKHQADIDKQTAVRAESLARETEPLQRDAQKLDKQISDLKKKTDAESKKLFKEKEKEKATLTKQIEQKTTKFESQEKEITKPVGKEQKLARGCRQTLQQVNKTALAAAKNAGDAAAVATFNAAKQKALTRLLLYAKFLAKIQPAYEKNKLTPPGRAAWHVKQMKLAIMRLKRLEARALEEDDQAGQSEEEPFRTGAGEDLSSIDKDLAAISEAELASAEEAPEEAEAAETETEQEIPTGPQTTTEPKPSPTADPLAAQWKQRWDKVTGALKTALQAKPANASQLQQLANGAFQQARPGTYPQALELLTRLEALLQGSSPGQASPSAAAADRGRLPVNPAGLGNWQAMRDRVVTQLRQLAREIASSQDPDAKEALILVNSIIQNLPPNPVNLQQVGDLERYIGQDDVVADACLALDVRTPLLEALEGLKPKAQTETVGQS
jgi:hypothetical protein